MLLCAVVCCCVQLCAVVFCCVLLYAVVCSCVLLYTVVFCCVLLYAVFSMTGHERYIKNDKNTTNISLLPFEFPLKSSDLYRISPNIPQTICHPSKGE